MDFCRTSHFRTTKFHRAFSQEHANLVRVTKISQPFCLHFQTHFSTFPFPRSANLCGASSHLFFYLCPPIFKNKEEENWQCQTQYPGLRTCALVLLHFSSFPSIFYPPHLNPSPLAPSPINRSPSPCIPSISSYEHTIL